MPRPNATSKLRVLLADDHLVVREGLKALINREGDMEVVGEVGDGRDICQAAEKLRPHVVVMDVSMPHVNGMEATRQLKQVLPEIRVLALSVHEDRVYIRRILDAGAAGYVPKRAVAAELLRAVRVVAGGALYVDPQVASQAKGLLTGSSGRVRGGALSGLSPREAEVLRLIARGFANKEIAAQLGITVKTIETHKARAMEKLGLQGRAAIVRLAIEEGWLGRDSP
jgi:DNA-binding NarL/FixJ family response regulator